METPNTLPEDPEVKIKALLAKMDIEERAELGKGLDQQRLAWQKAWYLRYVIGPFMAGQLFDLWQWMLARVDEYLWSWAQQSGTQAAPTALPPADPKTALRQALEKKSKNNSNDQT